jgi:hypothetical protein
MATFLLINGDGLVVNSIVWDGNLDTYSVPDGLTIQPTPTNTPGVGRGWTKNDNGTWSPPVVSSADE